jgi:macrolide transport system ATP-binding/permease protein
MGNLLRRIQYLFSSKRIEADLAEELEYHRELLARELAGDRSAASRALGNVTLAREDARGVWLLPWIESFWQDITYGIRGLWRQPGFTIVALAALGISIGLNTSLFTIFNAIAFRPWQVKDPAQMISLTRLFRKGPEQGHYAGFGVAEWRYMMEHNKSFRGLILSGNGEPVEANGQALKLRWVSGNYFSVLGLDMSRGRGFLPEEDRPQDPQTVAVLSYRAWQNRFSGDAAIVGKIVHLDDVPFTIVGVAPEGFTGTFDSADFWSPFPAHLALRPHDTGFKNFLSNPDHCCVSMAGRLAAGVTRAQASAEVDLLMRQFHANKEFEGAPAIIATGTALLEESPGDKAKIFPALAAMFVAMTLVLLLACANVGNLLLARAVARQNEIAVRLSLGGSRLRLIRQFLVESMVLATAASGIGLAIAALGPSLILPRLATDFLILQLTPDLRVCVYAIALAVVACIAFGLAPALHATRGSIAAAMKSETNGAGSRLALRSVLLASQVAISVILLAGAGLLIRGLQSAQHRDPGYRLNQVTVVTLELPASAYSGARGGIFTTQLQDALDHAGGLSRCAVISDAPMSNTRSWTHMRPAEEPADRDRMVQIHEVTAEYFDVLGISVVEGRNFTRDDAGRNVVLINQTAALRFWHGASPVGKLAFSNNKSLAVVGVVKDAYTTSLRRIEPALYSAMAGNSGIPQLLVADASSTTFERISAIVRQIEPRSHVTFVPLAENFRSQLEPAKYAAILAGALGILALGLASIGMSGVFAYIVRQRTREIGIRMALGAHSGQIVRLVLASNLRALLWGLVSGLAGAFGVSRLLQNMLNGVSPLDPLAYAAVFALLIIAAAAASALPARRAARVDPITALRWE